MINLKFGIDFDNTISAAPHEFALFIKMLTKFGHEVAITTWRKPDVREDIDAFFEQYQLVVPIVFCNGQAKKTRYDADIWIDDKPCTIDFGLIRPPRFGVYDPDEVFKLADSRELDSAFQWEEPLLVNHRAFK
ncbi:hypothetical protein SXHG_00012 [Synechococcus phage MRHenn-2013a]|nr:hypothetical protein SXHG_00012 [Synechococcus phage MRHenn-2013a]